MQGSVVGNKGRPKHICGKTFNISIVKKEPFSLALLKPIEMMLNACCGTCGEDIKRYNIINRYTTLSDVSVTSIRDSDIVFPILGRATTKTLYGYKYIPLLDAPSVYYFTRKATKAESVHAFIVGTLHLYPLLIIVVLLAVIAGFIGWSLETWKNVGEFPRPFFKGLFDGFWWSFISMTTVGYRDKSPRSYFGRVFSILWILIGITICSLFTAALTNQINSIKDVAVPGFTGKMVYALKDRLHDALIIASHGGILKTAAEHHDYCTDKSAKAVHNCIIKKLIRELKSKKIDGFIIDSNTYHHFIHENISRLVQFDKTEIVSYAEKRYYGMLLKQHDKYFRNFIDDNWLQLEACDMFTMNAKIEEKGEGNTDCFAPEGGHFYPFLCCALGIIAGIIVAGVIFEVKRKYFTKKEIIEIEM